jgi:hypothetical protein
MLLALGRSWETKSKWDHTEQTLGEHLSIRTKCCDLGMVAAHGEKMRKRIILVVNRRVLAAVFGQ